MRRKVLSCIAVAMLFLGWPAAVSAQSLPQKTIQIVVPYGPGGSPDVAARVIAQKLSENLGQNVVVENKAGGSGVIAAQYFLSRSETDGTTLFLVDNNIDAINAAVYPNLPYNVARDFIPVIQAARGYNYFVTNAASGITSLADLIARAKARPGEINYGSPGIATMHHLAMEQLGLMSGAKLTHIPYRGVQQATPALLKNEVSVLVASLASVASHVESGQMRLLAIGAPEASKRMPEVPTTAKLGYPDLHVKTNTGFAVKAGTPRPIVDRLNAELLKVLKSPDVISRIEAFGFEVVTGTPEEFSETLAADRGMYSRLVKEIDLKMN